jgi:hypothetical protein
MSDIVEILPGEMIVERAAIRELGPFSVHDYREQRSVVQLSFLSADGTRGAANDVFRRKK